MYTSLDQTGFDQITPPKQVPGYMHSIPGLIKGITADLAKHRKMVWPEDV